MQLGCSTDPYVVRLLKSPLKVLQVFPSQGVHVVLLDNLLHAEVAIPSPVSWRCFDLFAVFVANDLPDARLDLPLYELLPLLLEALVSFEEVVAGSLDRFVLPTPVVDWTRSASPYV